MTLRKHINIVQSLGKITKNQSGEVNGLMGYPKGGIQQQIRNADLITHYRNLLRMLVVAVFIAGVAIPVTQAAEKVDSPAFHTLFQPATVNAKWTQECSACHIAFPPGLLQAESWLNIMNGLKKHFGVDASLTPLETSEIISYLTLNASTRWRYQPPPSRISQAPWFKRAHSEHEAAWASPLVKTPSNCFACHKHSEHGDFMGGGGGCGNTSCHVF